MNRKQIDYSNPAYSKNIEKENVRIYKNLIDIYVREKKVVNEHQDTSKKVKKPQYADKSIIEDNLRLFVRLINVQPTKSLCKKELDKTHWKNVLLYKSRKFLNKKAMIRNAL